MSVLFQLKPTFTFSFHVSVPFFFFFSAWTANLLCRDKNQCSCTVVVLFTYCSSTVHSLKILKMGPTVLFTHYFATVFSVFGFQFSVSATISPIQTDPIVQSSMMQRKFSRCARFNNISTSVHELDSLVIHVTTFRTYNLVQTSNN